MANPVFSQEELTKFMDALEQKSADEQKRMASDLVKKLESKDKPVLEDALKSIACVVLIHHTLKGEGFGKSDDKFIKKATAIIPFVAAVSLERDRLIKAVERYAKTEKDDEKDDDQTNDLVTGIKNLSDYENTVKNLSNKSAEPKKTDGK
jgi:hypothetical protein